MFCLVLTYSAPHDPHRDSNLVNYAKRIVDVVLQIYPYGDVILLLNGGATSPTNPHTEADSMATVLRAQLQHRDAATRMRVTIRSRPATALDLRTSILQYWEIQHATGDPATIFCEKHRRPRTQVVAESVFGSRNSPTLVPIDFDEREYTLMDDVTRWIEFAFAYLSACVPGFYRYVEHPLRMRKIGRNPDETRRF